MPKQSFCVGNHHFSLFMPEYLKSEMELKQYDPFKSKSTKGELFNLQVQPKLSLQKNAKTVYQYDDGITSMDIFSLINNGYRFHIAYSGSNDYCIMDSDALFKTAQIQMSDNKHLNSYSLDRAMTILYVLSTAKLDTLLIHASVINNNNQGFAFLGKSCTGKSTHSQLWLDHIEGSELLNDDNPVIRVIDGKVWIFGSPWSGKTPCYKNESVPLKGIVKLRQASENKIKKLSVLQAYAAIFPACSRMRWEDEIMTGVHHTLEKLTMSVNCFQLDCLPDKDAANLSYNTINEDI